MWEISWMNVELMLIDSARVEDIDENEKKDSTNKINTKEELRNFVNNFL
jgi:hypothetical protein